MELSQILLGLLMEKKGNMTKVLLEVLLMNLVILLIAVFQGYILLKLL
jgi:hypothetical protein